MKLASTVETRNLAGAAGAWIVGHRRRLAPAVCVAAAVTAIAVFWIGPRLLQEAWLGRARAAHSTWVETDRIPGGRVLDAKGFLAGLRRLGPSPHLPDLTATGLSSNRSAPCHRSMTGPVPSMPGMPSRPGAA